jgi:L-threonylcarbamoyladenylate synthase
MLKAMQSIINHLRTNALGIIEHDTLPGIVARMTPENALAINNIKKRMPNKGFIVLIPNPDWVSKLAENVSRQARQLMASHWPGPLTIIFNKHPQVPLAITGGRTTIALRYPRHFLVTPLLHALNEPLLSTSANISNQNGVSSELLSAVQFTHGNINVLGIASTIVDATGATLQVIRQGECQVDR